MPNLRSFQRRTVDWVSQRFWRDDPPARRFLVADEVGLGKTLVASGVIAQGLSAAIAAGRPFRVVYICSNAILADQNRDRLFKDFTGRLDPLGVDRLTMLVDQLPAESSHAAVCFTPGTSFDFTHRLGTAEERAVLLASCCAAGWPDARSASARNLFRGHKGKDRFAHLLAERLSKLTDSGRECDKAILSALNPQGAHAACLLAEYRSLLLKYPQHNSEGDGEGQAQFISSLRRLVAVSVLKSLAPDLVILDEFQRFRHLLATEEEKKEDSDLLRAELAARAMAQELLGKATRARVLLLSATPFKPFTRVTEDEDHWQDFSKLMHFLLEDDPDGYSKLCESLVARRKALLENASEAAGAARLEAQAIMVRVMSRHERVSSSDVNGMLRARIEPLRFAPEHARDAYDWMRLARAVGYRDPLSLWESVPHGMHFIDTYEFAELVSERMGRARERERLLESIGKPCGATLPSRSAINRYEALPTDHPMLEWIIQRTLDHDWWRMPWLPPTMPYWTLASPFDGASQASKLLIFSRWRAVPKAVAGLLSYAAEQRAVTHLSLLPAQASHEDDVPDEGRWRRADSGALTSLDLLGSGQKPRWTTVCLVYPSRVLAEAIASVAKCRPTVPLASEALAQAASVIAPLLERLPFRRRAGVDRRWYALAPMILDLHGGGLERCCIDTSADGTDDHRLPDVLDRVPEVADELRSPPDDLAKVVARIALGSPGICARRALARAFAMSFASAELGTPSSQVGLALVRYLEKRPHALAIRADYPSEPFWQGILGRCLDGCLQAALDEQAHLLLADHPTADEMAKAIVDSLRLHQAPVTATKPPTTVEADETEPHVTFRTHFAVRFGAQESSNNGARESDVARLGSVRDSFNAPWWPMLLVTTTCGQEGLDFHRWCSSVVHWNLPWNPVDLEQREGRVARFRNIAVRRNVAEKHRAGLTRLPFGADPWAQLFAGIERQQDGLYPDWICPGSAAIERLLPCLPMGKNRQRYARLTELLSQYRALMGQPRQEELLYQTDARTLELLQKERFDLRPPEVGPGGVAISQA